jgi:hypothetical protein
MKESVKTVGRTVLSSLQDHLFLMKEWTENQIPQLLLYPADNFPFAARKEKHILSNTSTNLLNFLLKCKVHV